MSFNTPHEIGNGSENNGDEQYMEIPDLEENTNGDNDPFSVLLERPSRFLQQETSEATTAVTSSPASSVARPSFRARLWRFRSSKSTFKLTFVTFICPHLHTCRLKTKLSTIHFLQLLRTPFRCFVERHRRTNNDNNNDEQRQRERYVSPFAGRSHFVDHSSPIATSTTRGTTTGWFDDNGQWRTFIGGSSSASTMAHGEIYVKRQ
jgi:hypothetical protein